jgi:hypothetical protein
MTHELTGGRRAGQQVEIVKRNGTAVRVRFSDHRERWVQARHLRELDDRQSRYAQDRVEWQR